MNCGSHDCGCSTNAAAASPAATAAAGATRVAGSATPTASPTKQPQTYRAPANVVEAADRYQVTLDVPGSSPEGIDIQLHEGVLSVVAKVTPRTPAARPIHTEYGVGDYRREFRVAEDIDAGKIAASYAGGVLTIDLPKSSKAQPRRVPVSAN